MAQASCLGLAVQLISLEEFAQQQQGRFDVVTAFQIIEHIPDVNPLMKAAVRCLKRGGILVITVPNRLCHFRQDFEPLDQPLHHLSRRSTVQLGYLATRLGLRVQAIRHEPAGMRDARLLLRKWQAARFPLSVDSTLARLVARLVWGPNLHRFYAATGLLDGWQLWRMSVMAVLQRSAP